MSLSNVNSYSIPNATVYNTSGTEGYIVLNNIPANLGTNSLLNVLSGTNEYAEDSNSSFTYYKFTTTFSLPNPNLSNNGQLAIYMYVSPYISASQTSITKINYQVLVSVEANGSIQTSPVYTVNSTELITFNSLLTIPIYLTNLFPQLLQNVNVIYKVVVEAWGPANYNS